MHFRITLETLLRASLKLHIQNTFWGITGGLMLAIFPIPIVRAIGIVLYLLAALWFTVALYHKKDMLPLPKNARERPGQAPDAHGGGGSAGGGNITFPRIMLAGEPDGGDAARREAEDQLERFLGAH